MGEILYEIVITPVEKRIPKDTEKLIISADGILNFLTFSTLVDQAGKFLCEKYEIYNVSSGRDLIFGNKVITKSQEVKLFANPSFGEMPSNDLNSFAVKDLDRKALRDLSFKNLPGSISEAEQVSRITSSNGLHSNMKTGLSPRSESLYDVRSPKILHLKHGFLSRRKKKVRVRESTTLKRSELS